MSLPDERPPSRGRGILVVLGCLCILIFAGLVVLQSFVSSAGFEDKEQLKKLQSVAFADFAHATVDWPQWRGPNRDGTSAETGLLMTWPETGPQKLWEVPVGEGFSTPVIVQGRVYTMFLKDKQEHVVCWNADSGAELWHFRYDASFRNTYGSGPRSTPSIDGDHLYTVGGTGLMHCLKTHPKTPEGEVVWTKDLLAEFSPPALKWGVSFSPLVVGDRVFVQPGGRGGSVAALEKTTGKVLWQGLDDPPSYSSPVVATVAGQQQVIFFTGDHLVGVTPDKGDLLWRFPWKTNDDWCNIATPIVAQDYVFISCGYNKGCALVNIEKAGFPPPAVYEYRTMRNHFSSCVRFKDHLYGFDESFITCLELRTGQVKWKERGLGKGSLILAEGHLILFGDNGTLAVAVANPEKYVEKARYDTGLKGDCWASPVLAAGRLYLRDQEKMMCLKLRQ